MLWMIYPHYLCHPSLSVLPLLWMIISCSSTNCCRAGPGECTYTFLLAWVYIFAVHPLPPFLCPLYILLSSTPFMTGFRLFALPPPNAPVYGRSSTTRWLSGIRRFSSNQEDTNRFVFSFLLLIVPCFNLSFSLDKDKFQRNATSVPGKCGV
jgi:hypothetical protein